MKQNYGYAEYVLRDLGYTDVEASEIIEVIKRGDYAFPHKCKTSVDGFKCEMWMMDECTGIDVPVLWTPDEGATANTIILLAQDPLRDSDYWDYSDKVLSHSSHVIVGTPYALHLSDATKSVRVGTKHRVKRYNVGVYRYIIEALCERGYNVYCTDIFKYYMRETPCNAVSDFDANIFTNECNRLNYVTIIGMGKKAHQAIEKLRIDDSMVIRVKHPRSRPQRKKEQIVEEIIELL